MASRFRSWDVHFATDILEGKLPIEPVDIIPVGGRGRRELNIPKSCLTIPTISCKVLDSGSRKVSGRGKRLRNTEVVVPNHNFKAPQNSETTEEFKERLNKKTLKDDSVWPTLPTNIISSGGQKKKKQSQSVQKNNFIKNNELKQNPQPDAEDAKTYFKSDKSATNTSSNKLLKVKDNKEMKKSCDDDDVNGQFADCWEDIIVIPSESKDDANINVIETILETTKKEIIKEQCSIHDISTDRNEIYQSLFENIGDKKEHIVEIPLPCNDISTYDNYSHRNFLENLENKDCYILIENIAASTDEEQLKNVIESFGAIDLFFLQPSAENLKRGLVKMEQSSHCDWVISCFDGSLNDDESERLIVKRVEDILEESDDENTRLL